MDNDLILTDSEGTAAGYGDTVQLVLDKLGNESFGPELSTNGDFETGDFTGYEAISAPGFIVPEVTPGNKGRMEVIDPNVSGSPRITQTLNDLIVGKVYEVSATLSSYREVSTASTFGLVILGNDLGYGTAYRNGVVTWKFVASASTVKAFEIYARRFAAGTAGDFVEVDNISVRELKGTHAYQNSSSLKPVRGRVPVVGRRNSLNQTDDLSGSSWGNASGRITVSGDLLTVGVTTGFSNVLTQAPDSISAIDGLSIEAKPENSNYLALQHYNGSAYEFSFFNLATASAETLPSYVSAEITQLADGWCKIEISLENTSTIGRLGICVAASGSSTACVANNSIRVRKPQYEGGEPTPYQRVSNPNDIFEEGQDHIEFLRFDGVDDKMVQAFPDGLTGDLVVCGTQGSWVDYDVVVAAGDYLTIGPKNLPNTTGVFPALGDIIGWLPLGRTLTEDDVDRIVGYYKTKGAKGQLVPDGVEVLSNTGGPFTSTDGWAPTNSILSVVEGWIRVANDGGFGRAEFVFEISEPTTLEFTYRCRGVSQSLNSRVIHSALGLVYGPQYNNGVDSGVVTDRIFLSEPGTITIYFGNRSTTAGEYSEFFLASVQKLVPEEELA